MGKIDFVFPQGVRDGLLAANSPSTSNPFLTNNTGNTNWRGYLASDPLSPQNGDWYTNSTNEIDYYYDSIRGVWNSNGILRLTSSQLASLSNPQLGMQVYLTDANDLGFRVYNGRNWTRLNLIREELTNQTALGFGMQILMISAQASSGNSLIGGTGLANNYGGSTLDWRRGTVSCSIAGATVNSRASLIPGGSYFHRLIPEVKWYFDGEVALHPTLIDFANDPVLNCFGILNNHFTPNPLEGIYIRQQRTGETPFLKIVIRTAGIETVTDSLIPSDFSGLNYLKIGFYWDGLVLTIFIKSDNQYQAYSITNLVTLFPAVVAASFNPGIAVIRNGLPLVGSVKTSSIDTFSWWHSTVQGFDSFN